MSEINEIFDEQRAQSGIGSALYHKNESGKYSIISPATKIPSVKGTSESIEIDVTTSVQNGAIEGKTKLEKVDFEVYNHRDNKRRFAKLVGRQLEFIACDGDYAGERFVGTVSYKVGERTSGEATKATVTITPSAFLGDIDNAYPLIQETATFVTQVPGKIIVPSDTKKFELDIALKHTDATFTVVSEAPTIATATATDGKLLITGLAEGSCVVVLTSQKTGCAPWFTTILVIVPKLKP